jgi:hypothetical protein
MLHQCGDNLLHTILSFVIEPLNVWKFSALQKRFCRAVSHPNAWEMVRVDTSRVRPKGSLAHQLWKSWFHSAFVIGGAWEQWVATLQLCPTVRAWTWRRPVTIDGESIFVSKTSVCTRRLHSRLCMREAAGSIVFGLADTSDPREIKKAFDGCCLVGRGPIDIEYVEINFVGVELDIRSNSVDGGCRFFANGKCCGGRTEFRMEDYIATLERDVQENRLRFASTFTSLDVGEFGVSLSAFDDMAFAVCIVKAGAGITLQPCWTMMLA